MAGKSVWRWCKMAMPTTTSKLAGGYSVRPAAETSKRTRSSSPLSSARRRAFAIERGDKSNPVTLAAPLGGGHCQNIFDGTAQRGQIGTRNQADAVGSHAVIRGDDRRAQVKRLAHGDSVAVIIRRAEHEVAAGDGLECGGMGQVA